MVDGAKVPAAYCVHDVVYINEDGMYCPACESRFTHADQLPETTKVMQKPAEHHAGCDLMEKTGHFCTCGADRMKTKRFVTDGSLPTPRQAELMVIGMEEAFEVLEELHKILNLYGQRSSKAMRFGLTQTQPGHAEDNATRLGKEAGQLMGVIMKLVEIGVLDNAVVDKAAEDKHVALDQYMQHQA